MTTKIRLFTFLIRPGILIVLLCANACATIEGPTEPQDPFERYNRAMYQFNESFDRNVAVPVAEAYRNVVPDPINKGISNFFRNLDDVVVVINDVLQLKFEQAAQDATRIIFNTTFGLLGFIDVSTSWDLPKHNEDFGQTLGYWGVPPGPYFIIPFLGPSTIRDSAGLATDYLYFDPVLNQVDDVTLKWSLFTLNLVDLRADLLGVKGLLDTAALDPYIFTREAYLQRRRNRVYDGNPPQENYDFYEEETVPAGGGDPASQ